jgi:glutamate racemase
MGGLEIMDKRPIGVFDSGLGGLTVVKKLAEHLWNEDIIYLGDTGRVPYGPRSRDTIIKYAKQNAAFLMGFDIKTMVVACNTVCSVAFDILDNLYDIPVFEVVSSPAKAAAEGTRNNKVGVIGTTATIRSGAYAEALRKISPEITAYSTPCPLLVPLVEEGWTGIGDETAFNITERYLKSLRESEVDTLIMGCTHYPLLREVISKVMGPDVKLIDSGAETAKLAAENLRDRGMLSDRESEGTVKYFVTDSIEGFSKLASRYLDSDVKGLVEQVTLE